MAIFQILLILTSLNWGLGIFIWNDLTSGSDADDSLQSSSIRSMILYKEGNHRLSYCISTLLELNFPRKESQELVILNFLSHKWILSCYEWNNHHVSRIFDTKVKIFRVMSSQLYWSSKHSPPFQLPVLWALAADNYLDYKQTCSVFLNPLSVCLFTPGQSKSVSWSVLPHFLFI